MSVVVAVADTRRSSSGECLRALRRQLRSDTEVIVVGDVDYDDLRSWAQVVPCADKPVPVLWSIGIAEARGGIVALLADTVIPDPNWLALTERSHDDCVVGVGGPIEPGPRLHIVDWAVYFCRYASYGLPLPTAPVDVPADNASYRADILRQYASSFTDGFWEPFVHRRLRQDGHAVVMRSERIVRYSAGASARAFRRQRFTHGLEHGRLRSVGSPRVLVVAGIVSAPAVPVVMLARVYGVVWGRKRHRARLLVATPTLAWFYGWWAAGELCGRLRVVTRRT